MSHLLPRNNPFFKLYQKILLLLVTVFSVTLCFSQAPIVGFTYLGAYGGHHYYKSTGNHAWPDAKAMATTNGGYLATINSAGENDFIFNNAVSPVNCHCLENSDDASRFLYGTVWIGYNDATTENTFLWDNGEPVCYTNWNEDEPNNFGDGEDYVQMLPWNGKWNDYFNNVSLPFILEIGAPTGPAVSLIQPDCTTPTGTITVTFPAPGAGISYSIDGTDYSNTTGVFANLAPGNYSVTAKDGSCISLATPATINPAPASGPLTASPNVLWPPNHKMVLVTIGSNCGTAQCTINGVTVNEEDNSIGDGNTVNDWQLIPGTNTLYLRAERKGPGIGRVYTVHTSCGDVSVSVPHDQSRNRSIGSTEISENNLFNVQALSNPSSNNFKLRITGSAQQKIILNVMDIYGRQVESREVVQSNGTVQIGDSYRPGIYLISVTQGDQRKQLKLVKQ